jgi:hypothetical protein
MKLDGTEGKSIMDRELIGWVIVVLVAFAVGFFASRLWGIWEAYRERIGRGGGLPSAAADDAPGEAPSLAPVSIRREAPEPRPIPTAEPSHVRRRDEVRWSCSERRAAWEALPGASREALADLGGEVPHERIGCPLCLALARSPCDRDDAEAARSLATLRAEVEAERSSEETQVFVPADRRAALPPGQLYARPRLLRPPPLEEEPERPTVPARRGGAA